MLPIEKQVGRLLGEARRQLSRKPAGPRQAKARDGLQTHWAALRQSRGWFRRELATLLRTEHVDLHHQARLHQALKRVAARLARQGSSPEALGSWSVARVAALRGDYALKHCRQLGKRAARVLGRDASLSQLARAAEATYRASLAHNRASRSVRLNRTQLERRASRLESALQRYHALAPKT